MKSRSFTTRSALQTWEPATTRRFGRLLFGFVKRPTDTRLFRLPAFVALHSAASHSASSFASRRASSRYSPSLRIVSVRAIGPSGSNNRFKGRRPRLRRGRALNLSVSRCRLALVDPAVCRTQAIRYVASLWGSRLPASVRVGQHTLSRVLEFFGLLAHPAPRREPAGCNAEVGGSLRRVTG